MEREADPQLWELLGHSKVAEPSPFFARNVLRAIREQESAPRGVRSWLQLRWFIPSVSAVAALLIALLSLHRMEHRAAPASVTTESAGATSMEVADADLATDLDVLTGEDDADDAPLL